jgi:hypothetical protein
VKYTLGWLTSPYTRAGKGRGNYLCMKAHSICACRNSLSLSFRQHKQTDRQTDRQIDGKTERDIDMKREREQDEGKIIVTSSQRQPGRQIVRKKDREKDRSPHHPHVMKEKETS